MKCYVTENRAEGSDQDYTDESFLPTIALEPLVEMSQDCIVEWTEKSTKASPVPPKKNHNLLDGNNNINETDNEHGEGIDADADAGVGSIGRTNRDNSYQASHKKRRWNEEEDVKESSQQEREQQLQGQQQSEQEINAIFQLLQKEQNFIAAGTDSLMDADTAIHTGVDVGAGASTQPIRNHQRYNSSFDAKKAKIPMAIPVESMISANNSNDHFRNLKDSRPLPHRPVVSSLASRRYRRQQQQQQQQQQHGKEEAGAGAATTKTTSKLTSTDAALPQRKRRVSSTTTNLQSSVAITERSEKRATATSPVTPVRPIQSPNESKSGGGAFDSLQKHLQQLHQEQYTHQHSEKQHSPRVKERWPPLFHNKDDKNNSNISSSRMIENSNSTKDDELITGGQAMANHGDKTTLIPTAASNDTLNPAVSSSLTKESREDTFAKPLMPQQVNTAQANPSITTTVDTTKEEEFGDFPDVDFSSLDQLVASRSKRSDQVGTDIPANTSMNERNTIVSQKDKNDGCTLQTLPSSTNTLKVGNTSSTVQTTICVGKENNENQPKQSFPLSRETKSKSLSVDIPTVDKCIEKENNNDAEFDDFPDMDWEEIERQALAPRRGTAATSKTTTSPKNLKELPPKHIDDGASDFDDFPEIDLDMVEQAIAKRSLSQPKDDPLSTNVVRNQRLLPKDAVGLSHLKFSRYRVVSVHDDTTAFQKTVSVASWTESMAGDSRKEADIHRNATVRTDQRSSNSNARLVSSNKWNIKPSSFEPVGYLQLRGQWYYTALEAGDDIHVCSLAGRYRTDSEALPIILHSHPPVGSDIDDDLVLIHYPDQMMTPTVISETVACPRRAVLKQRNGSSGLTSSAALMGTLRHALFGTCLQSRQFDVPFVRRQIQKIVREHAEAMVGCGASSNEVEQQLLDTLPVLKKFVQEYTTFFAPQQAQNDPRAHVPGHIGPGIKFAAHTTYSIEEPVISPELALRGYVDAVMETTISSDVSKNSRSVPKQQPTRRLSHSLMALELKTGHNQKSQHTHMGQLSLYTLMLQGRYGVRVGQSIPRKALSPIEGKPDPEGASDGGILLYLNNKSSSVTHVAPSFDEFKSLLGQRNIIASELTRASKPRGVTLQYEEDEEKDLLGTVGGKKSQPTVILHEPAPPVELPQVLPSAHQCSRCFENRTCMVYARSETERADPTNVQGTHAELLLKFTSQLEADDLNYFRKWDRLIDLEAHSTVGSMAAAWLVESEVRERTNGESVASLKYDGASPRLEGSGVLLRFKRSNASQSHSSLDNISIGKGSHVVVSTDGTLFEDSQSDPKLQYMNTQREMKSFRHRMNVVRGSLEDVSSTELVIAAKREDLDRIRGVCNRFQRVSSNSSSLHFRVDKDNSNVGVGTLRQNLINLFSFDYRRGKNEESSPADLARKTRLPRLRRLIVRLEPPTFHKVTDDILFRQTRSPINDYSMKKLSEEFKSLNLDQQNAVRKAVAMNGYTLVQGLPGTGKTSTLSFIARLLVAHGKRVLITSYTNAAVDNVVIKLQESGACQPDKSTGFSRVVRVGPRHSCHKQAQAVHVQDIAEEIEASNLGRQKDFQRNLQPPRAEALSVAVSEARIVCSTVLTVPRSSLLINESFDVVIVDEAGQTSQPAVLGALMAADSFILVGDHQQLPPLVNSEIAQEGGYGESLLMRLAENHPEAIAPLTYQYRMNEEICKLSSYLIYGGRLKCGSQSVRERRLSLPNYPQELPKTISQKKGLCSWLNMTTDPEKPVLFVDTDNMRKQSSQNLKEYSSKDVNKAPALMESLEEKRGGRAGGRVTNPTEVQLIRYIIHGFISTGLPANQIGVISPFRAQVQLLSENETISTWVKSGLEVSTIDRYQGRDKPVIILSMVRSNTDGNAGRLLQDKRRLNVALTRAKSKLIVVGSYSTLRHGSAPLRPMLGRVNNNGQRQPLPENALDCYSLT